MRRRRECRVPEAPVAPCAKGRKHTVVDHRYAGSDPAFPARWCYGFLRALLGDRACLPPSSTDKSANLTPASGVRTTRLRRPHQRRSSKAHPRPPPPAPNVRDDRETPFSWARDKGQYADDLYCKRRGMFLRLGLDRPNHLAIIEQFRCYERSAGSPDERSDMRDHRSPGYRFAHPGYDVRERSKARSMTALVGRPPQFIPSSSSIMPDITDSPPSQNFGSLASNPNGLRSSE